jgi:hypothetical protein
MLIKYLFLLNFLHELLMSLRIIMQTFLKPFKKLAGRVLLGLKPLALRARVFKPNKTLLLVF